MSGLTQAILDGAGCDMPDCGHDHSVLYLVGGCHPNAGLTASYAKATGSVTLRCKRCKKVAAEIAVAATAQQQGGHG